MAIYSENKVSSVTTTRQDELQIYGADQLGLLRRNMELDEEQARTTQLAKECPYCPVPQTIAPGMLRIVEVLYDSPLSNPTEDHTGEFVVLRNATGLTLPLASISITYPGGVFTFGASDVLAPYEFAIVAHWSGSPGSFAAQFGLSGYNTFPEVNWFWDTAMTLPDAGGTVGLLDFTDGVPTLLEAVNFGGSGITASNAYCATACSTAQTVQLDHFLTSPSGAFDAGEWAAATITGMGTIGIGSFVLDHSYARGLGMREYELKDHLGNVCAVVSDKKMSDIVSGLPEDFRAEVLTMRDHYAFGMDLPGAVFTGSSGYRYGFNGMERDDEVKGAGMSYDFGARVYDPRVGRWWSVDQLEKKYPAMSGYGFVGNMPIIAIDPDGKQIKIVLGNVDKARFLNLLHSITGADFDIDNKGNLIITKADQNTIRSKVLMDQIREATALDGKIIPFYLQAGSDFEFDQFDNGEVDIQDFENIKNNPTLQAVYLSHIIAERRADKKYKSRVSSARGGIIDLVSNEKAFNKAHQAAWIVDVQVYNELMGTTLDGSQASDRGDVTPRMSDDPNLVATGAFFGNNIEWIFVESNGNTPPDGNGNVVGSRHGTRVEISNDAQQDQISVSNPK